MYTHVLSEKSSQQNRNVFIWCSNWVKISMGWHVDDNAPPSISTAHRWISTLIQAKRPRARPDQLRFALFPVVVRPAGVLVYDIERSDPALPRESQDNIPPGDYGIFNEDGSRTNVNYSFTPTPLSYSDTGSAYESYSVQLAKKSVLPSSIAERALARDKACVFTGVSSPTCDSEMFQVTWIFPPFLGYTVSHDPWIERTYHDNPDASDLGQFMVVTNAISGCRDVIALFYENKLGVDVDDNYRIVVFDKSERMLDAAPIKSHVVFIDGQDRPSDRYLRLHFQHCLAVSVCGGDPTDDYQEQEIELFMEELGMFDNTMDFSHPDWKTPLGREVYASYVREQRANLENLKMELDNLDNVV